MPEKMFNHDDAGGSSSKQGEDEQENDFKRRAEEIHQELERMKTETLNESEKQEIRNKIENLYKETLGDDLAEVKVTGSMEMKIPMYSLEAVPHYILEFFGLREDREKVESLDRAIY